MAMYSNRLIISASTPGRCVSQLEVHSTRLLLCKTVQPSVAPWHRPTNHGRSHPIYALPVASIEDGVNTSSECDWPPDEFGVRSKAATFEHVWVGNSKGSATDCMTLNMPARTFFSDLSISPEVQPSPSPPPLSLRRLPVALDNVRCAIFSVKVAW